MPGKYIHTELLEIINGIDNTAICFDVNHLLIEPQVTFVKNTKERSKIPTCLTTTVKTNDIGYQEKELLTGQSYSQL